MTLGDLCDQVYGLVRDGRINGQAHKVKIRVYDPDVEDYIEATGVAVYPDGSIALQTPA